MARWFFGASSLAARSPVTLESVQNGVAVMYY